MMTTIPPRAHFIAFQHIATAGDRGREYLDERLFSARFRLCLIIQR